MKRLIAVILLTITTAALTVCCGGQGSAVETPKDLEQARLGVMVGTTGEAIAKARFPKADVKSFDDIMDAVAAMKAGQLDAVITALPTSVNLVKHNPEFTILPDQLADEKTAIALKKGNPEMLARLNAIIAEFRKDGTLADMSARWLKTDLSPYEDKSPPVPTEGWVLKVGVCATREPMNFVDKDGNVSGHDGELARRIAAKLGRPLEFQNMKFMALIPALQSGKIDVIITGMTATDERRKSVDFTDHYFNNKQVLIVRKPTAAEEKGFMLASPEDLKDKSIGVLLGSVHDGYATRTFPRATILRYKSPTDVILGVKSGRADAGLYTLDEALRFLKIHPDLGLLEPSLTSEPVAMGFNKEDNELRTAFNSYLKKIKENGLYDEMIKRWMTDCGSTMPEIQRVTEGELLTVGLISDCGLPFTTVKDGQLVGFNIELLDRFAAEQGRKVEYLDMEFGSLIGALAAKKIDIIGVSLSITEERKKSIAFSNPHYKQGTVAFAQKKNLARYQKKKPKEHDGRLRVFFAKVGESFYNNIILEKRYLLLWEGLKTTVEISVFATLVGTLLGGLVCYMRMSRRKVLSLPARVYISLLRGVPVLVFLMIIFYVVFASINISPVLVSVIAFGLNFAAYAAEIFRTGIEGIERGQSEAGIAMGFTRVGTFVSIILPQTVQRVLPVYKGEFISMLKATSIVGYIAVQDLTKASDIIRSRTFDAFFPLFMVAALYFVISWLLIQFMDYLARRTDPKFRRRRQEAAA
ncbi:MAG: ABC transporter permease subunit [Thermodesulfobacteriota bacterium]